MHIAARTNIYCIYIYMYLYTYIYIYICAHTYFFYAFGPCWCHHRWSRSYSLLPQFTRMCKELLSAPSRKTRRRRTHQLWRCLVFSISRQECLYTIYIYIYIFERCAGCNHLEQCWFQHLENSKNTYCQFLSYIHMYKFLSMHMYVYIYMSVCVTYSHPRGFRPGYPN